MVPGLFPTVMPKFLVGRRGPANKKTVTIQPEGKDQSVLLATTKTKKQNKRSSLLHKSVMKKEFPRMVKAVKNQVVGIKLKVVIELEHKLKLLLHVCAEKGVPDFWLIAIKNNEVRADKITERDEGAVKYLKDIKWFRVEEPKGFKLEFYFDTNPYFKNSVLTKTYHMIDEDEPILAKPIG
ncbi:Detected protein of confused Function [Hibiscus syriacus]|uniref:Detected protein of confused Function n=1 Tax=Hibiscus syriacus TaxID=106335 RepID=A0A6A3AH89_HIBSY|nr:nucleosome assembly protein 1;3-like [Hibiscus syriacus]KAE8703476.1 Detected protein of confused Function [Hibiscus syriacus]